MTRFLIYVTVFKVFKYKNPSFRLTLNYRFERRRRDMANLLLKKY
jgi:hypothetical protein